MTSGAVSPSDPDPGSRTGLRQHPRWKRYANCRMVDRSDPSPLPSPGGRGRSSGVTCPRNFFVGWTARWLLLGLWVPERFETISAGRVEVPLARLSPTGGLSPQLLLSPQPTPSPTVASIGFLRHHPSL